MGLWVIVLAARGCYCNYSHPNYVLVYYAKAFTPNYFSFGYAAMNITRPCQCRQSLCFPVFVLYSITGITNASYLKIGVVLQSITNTKELISKHLCLFFFLSPLESRFSASLCDCSAINVNIFYSFCK